MRECSKSIARRLSDSRFVRMYFAGHGVDIGGAPDPLCLYQDLFPLVASIKTWDLNDGDAQFMASVADNTYDFVFSSHCLEHLRDPAEGLRNWLRVVKPGGYIVFAIPDEDLYEQGVFPSTFNLDHKGTFTIYKPQSWSPKSTNVLDLVRTLGPEAAIEKIELLDATYRYRLPRYDQTTTPIGECGIEVVIRKRAPAEVASLGRLPGSAQPSPEVRIHLNQYRDDKLTLRSANAAAKPFENDKDL
jgi:SAM-dependent methyltransferase